MAFDSHIVTVRRLKKYIDDVIGKKANLPNNQKTIIDNITDAVGKLQTEVDDVRGQIRTNLLNPTARTQTINGITFTNNGDGTYTVNGTASDTIYYQLADQFTNFVLSRKYKLVGCPQGGDGNNYLVFDDSNNATGVDIGNGAVYTPKNKPTIFIRIMNGTTVNNLTFKPMLTTDLSATYDDFVPYTGDSGRLNEDVAALFRAIHRR